MYTDVPIERITLDDIANMARSIYGKRAYMAKGYTITQRFLMNDSIPLYW